LYESEFLALFATMEKFLITFFLEGMLYTACKMNCGLLVIYFKSKLLPSVSIFNVAEG